MCINRKEFIKRIATNLKSNSKADKFHVNFRYKGKRIEKVIDLSNTNLDKRSRIDLALKMLIELREKVINSGTNININSNLNQVAEMFFADRDETLWSLEMESIYNLHIKPVLGNYKVVDIKRVHIDSLKNGLRKFGKIGSNIKCEPRTVQKILKNVLKPILEYAYDNEIINRIPKVKVKAPKNRPKHIKSPSETFLSLYNTVLDLYKDNPFYRALFLFFVFGRRKNEVLTLTWEDIDFENKTYTIKEEVNKIGENQVYELPKLVKEALFELGPKKGLIFKSKVTGNKLTDLRRQVLKVKEKAGIKKLTTHMFRNVLASYLATRPDVTPHMIAAALGHVDLQTATKHYITKDHTTASMSVNRILSREINKSA